MCHKKLTIWRSAIEYKCANKRIICGIMKNEINTKKIKEYIKANGLSAEEFAGKAEISVTTLRKILKGSMGVRLESLVKIAAAMQIHVSELGEK